MYTKTCPLQHIRQCKKGVRDWWWWCGGGGGALPLCLMLRVCCVACYLIGHEVYYRQPQDRKRREQHAEDPANLHELPLRRILTQVAVVEIEAEEGRGCGED